VPIIAPGEYMDTDTPSQEARTEAWETLRALAQLRPDLRAVVALDALGWKNREIAVHLDIPYGTAATRLRAARREIVRIRKRRGG
jgi:DNA-directed RNA polymerase specialized sigma24 family protein